MAGGGFPNPAMDAVVARAEAQLGALERIHRDLSELSVVGRSDAGRIEVRIDGNGLADLRLLPGAAGGDAGRLATMIVDAAAAAARELGARRSVMTREFLDEFGDTPGSEGTELGSGASNLYASTVEALGSGER